MSDAEWGVVFVVYVVGGYFWTGAFDANKRPKTYLVDSALKAAWAARKAERRRKEKFWIIGLVGLIAAWSFL
jgi:hypothetical protein